MAQDAQQQASYALRLAPLLVRQALLRVLQREQKKRPQPEEELLLLFVGSSGPRAEVRRSWLADGPGGCCGVSPGQREPVPGSCAAHHPNRDCRTRTRSRG